MSPTPLGAFERSPLGAFYRSPLGARGKSSEPQPPPGLPGWFGWSVEAKVDAFPTNARRTEVSYPPAQSPVSCRVNGPTVDRWFVGIDWTGQYGGSQRPSTIQVLEWFPYYYIYNQTISESIRLVDLGMFTACVSDLTVRYEAQYTDSAIPENQALVVETLEQSLNSFGNGVPAVFQNWSLNDRVDFYAPDNPPP